VDIPKIEKRAALLGPKQNRRVGLVGKLTVLGVGALSILGITSTPAKAAPSASVQGQVIQRQAGLILMPVDQALRPGFSAQSAQHSSHASHASHASHHSSPTFAKSRAFC